MQTLFQSLLLLISSVILALAGMVLVRRFTRVAGLEAHREIAGFVYATIGVIYAVLLAFVSIVTWERYNDASYAAEQEATIVTSLYQLAQGFSAAGRQQVQTTLAGYTRAVIDVEWDLMARGRGSPQAAQQLSELWQEYAQLPQADRETANYAESLHQMSQLQNQRGERLTYAAEKVPRVVWLVLIGGAVITIGFTYLFGVRSVLAQALITLAITVTVSGVLILTFVLDDPFRGDVRVQPDGLRVAQELLTK